MRLRHLHHDTEWLPEDYELPADLANVKDLFVWRVHRTPDKALVALKLGPEHGAGIWDATGKLLHYVRHGGDIEFLREAKQALCLAPLFKQGPAGHANALRVIDIETFQVVTEAVIYTSRSRGQYLVLDGNRQSGLATWREQREWGYATFDVATLTPLAASLEWETATLSPPAFAPESSIVVSCHYHRNRWWVGEEGDWYDPSPGGLHKAATLTAHELSTNVVTAHDVFVTVPEGWLPDRPEEDEWQTVWGPEFVSPRQFRIWLPDDSQEVLTLPLPPQVVVPRPLLSERPWP